MATSGVVDFSITARDLAKIAMQEGQVIAAGEEPTAIEVSDVIIRLNAMLKSWEVRGYSLWRQKTMEVDLVGGVNPTALDETVYDVAAVRFQTDATNERPLTEFDRDQYKLIPNKAQSGNPSIYYADRQRDEVSLHVWPVPAAASKVNIDYLAKIEVVTNEGQTLDIPQDWHETVYTLLAVKICGMFGYPVPEELAVRAAVLQSEIDAQDRPSSYFMGSWLHA